MAGGMLLENKRKLARRELLYYLPVKNLADGRELGRMIDIHAEGLLLMGNEELSSGTTYDVTLELPKAFKAALGREELQLRGAALWRRTGVNSRYLETGFMFTDLEAEQREVIERLIHIFAISGGSMSVTDAVMPA